MEDMSSVFKDLDQNRTRVSIMEMISREPLTIKMIAERLGISQTAVIKNLKVLERNGVVDQVTQNGKKGFISRGTFFVYEAKGDSDEFLMIYINKKGRKINDKQRVIYSSSCARILQDFRLSSAVPS